MERLTIRDETGKAHATRIGYYDIIEKLAEYEDLEEQGLLLRLPLSVGDSFWELNENHLEPCIYSRVAHSLSHVVYCMQSREVRATAAENIWDSDFLKDTTAMSGLNG